jgi:hypothetical protein
VHEEINALKPLSTGSWNKRLGFIETDWYDTKPEKKTFNWTRKFFIGLCVHPCFKLNPTKLQ